MNRYYGVSLTRVKGNHPTIKTKLKCPATTIFHTTFLVIELTERCGTGPRG